MVDFCMSLSVSNSSWIRCMCGRSVCFNVARAREAVDDDDVYLCYFFSANLDDEQLFLLFSCAFFYGLFPQRRSSESEAQMPSSPDALATFLAPLLLRLLDGVCE